MSKVLIEESNLSSIAGAIRSKVGGSTLYKPSEMAAAINTIDTGGITPTGSISITENGTVDVTQYASAAVNVPNSYAASDEGKVVSNGSLVAQTARVSEITENGTYDTTLNNSIAVNVSGGSGDANLQVKSVTQNGVILPDSGYDGMSRVLVNVDGSSGTPGVWAGLDTPSNSLGSDGDYYYKRGLDSGGYAITITKSMSTASSSLSGGYLFSFSESVAIVGFRVNPSYATCYLHISDELGESVFEKTASNLTTSLWNDVLLETPLGLIHNKKYILWYSNTTYGIKYVRSNDIVPSSNIVIYKKLDATSRNVVPTRETDVWSGIDLMLSSDYYHFKNEYIKENGVWREVL